MMKLALARCASNFQADPSRTAIFDCRAVFFEASETLDYSGRVQLDVLGFQSPRPSHGLRWFLRCSEAATSQYGSQEPETQESEAMVPILPDWTLSSPRADCRRDYNEHRPDSSLK